MQAFLKPSDLTMIEQNHTQVLDLLWVCTPADATSLDHQILEYSTYVNKWAFVLSSEEIGPPQSYTSTIDHFPHFLTETFNNEGVSAHANSSPVLSREARKEKVSTSCKHSMM